MARRQAGVLFPYSPWDMTAMPFAPPLSDDALLGADALGCNIAARIAYGARVSLLVGLTSTAVALVIGVLLGAVAGYHGGWVDDAIMRFTELFQTIPNFVLAVEPEIPIADEPTTALDVTTQKQILDLIKRIQREWHMAVLFIAHDLPVAAQVRDTLAVMQLGRIVEMAPAREVFSNPKHDYTRTLLAAIPGRHWEIPADLDRRGRRSAAQGAKL